jgi:hypothetical protein
MELPRSRWACGDGDIAQAKPGQAGMTDFYGLPTRAIYNDHIQLEYLAEAGLRDRKSVV